MQAGLNNCIWADSFAIGVVARWTTQFDADADQYDADADGDHCDADTDGGQYDADAGRSTSPA